MNRIERYINREWYFAYGIASGAEKAKEFNGMTEIGLPHTFTLPYYGADEFYIGYGVYGKYLNISKEYIGNRIILEFGAVFQVAEVYINGEHVKTHKGGYTAFIVDISDKVNAGINNLFVRVNNIWSPTIAPRAGEHTFCGGIYRDVKLIVTNNSYIDWYGVAITTPHITDKLAEVAVSVDTVNCYGMQLETIVYDIDGNAVAQAMQIVDDDTTVCNLTVESANLWSPEQPYLYTLVVNVGEDSTAINFGVRSIKWDKDKGFYLNGKRYLLQGANVHQDHGGWGDAVTHTGIARDISIMKDCGMNMIRGSHYPHHTVFAEECDRQGILFWSENVFWGIGGFVDEGYWDCSAMPTKKEYYSEFEQSLKQTLFEMIKTNRNHPSIIAWSMGNEIFFSAKGVLVDAKAMVARLVEFCHKLDTSRMAAIGGVQREGFDTIGDIAGYNGDGAVLFKNPTLPNIVAEYGSIPSYRPGKFSLNFTKGSEETYPWRAGRAIWCGFHHGSIANIGNLGIVDLYRLPLNAWYAYREKLCGICPPQEKKRGVPTALRITADKLMIQNDGLDDTHILIEAIDARGNLVACDIEVTLSVVSGGGLLPCGQSMVFNHANKSFFDGACAIELRGYYAGGTKIVASALGLQSCEIDIGICGAEEYDGRVISLPQEPTFAHRKKNKGVDIIALRPVIVTSEQQRGMSKHISDGQEDTFWQPSPADKNPIITLDLENKYDNFSVGLEFIDKIVGKIKVIGSNDKNKWIDIVDIKMRQYKRTYKFKVQGVECRYLKIVVSTTKGELKIKKISAMQ